MMWLEVEAMGAAMLDPIPKQPIPKDDPRYQPTKAELEADVSIRDATPEELALAVVGRHPRRISQ